MMESGSQTLDLFQYLFDLNEIEQNVSDDNLYLKAEWIRFFLIKIERAFDIYHPFYTLHDHTHSDAVVEHLYEILELAGLLRNSSKNAISYHETFYLIAAAYLHDVGMVIMNGNDHLQAKDSGQPLGEWLRATHHTRSANFVYQERKRFMFEAVDADIIAALCEGHRLETLADESFDLRYDHRSRPIRVRMLASLLRVADELDMSHKRAPEYQRMLIDGLLQFNKLARRHWMKHYYTESVHFRVETERRLSIRIIKVNVNLVVPDEKHQDYLEDLIRKRLKEHIDSVDLSEYGFQFKIGDIVTRFNDSRTNSVLRKSDVRILYVDDDEIYRNNITDLLHSHDFPVVMTEPNAKEALVAVANRDNATQFQVIILDLDMLNLHDEQSKRAGLDLIKPLRNLAKDAQIMLFTSSKNERIIAEAHHNGVEVLFKTTEPEQHLIDSVINKISRNYILVDD